MGEERVVDWCCRLISGEGRPDDPDLGWLGGTEAWLPYWRRVWGARGLLYVWDDSPATIEAVGRAMSDDHWRVREMGCKVVRARQVEDLFAETEELRRDEHPRVRAAAERAIRVL